MEIVSPDYSDEKNVPAVKDLNELVAELHKVFAHDEVNVDYVKALLGAYKSKPKDWKKFALFDQHRYTRNLIDGGNGKFNLIALCWGENQGSSIHDHSDAHCFVKMLDGELKETMYEWPNESEGETEMQIQGSTIYKRNGVAYINDSMGLHRMENPSHSDKTVSLHLYSPPFMECKSFDERTGHTRSVQVTFWSQEGQRTPFMPATIACGPVGGDACGGGITREPEDN